jgi:hypothetical protein
MGPVGSIIAGSLALLIATALLASYGSLTPVALCVVARETRSRDLEADTHPMSLVRMATDSLPAGHRRPVGLSPCIGDTHGRTRHDS